MDCIKTSLGWITSRNLIAICLLLNFQILATKSQSTPACINGPSIDYRGTRNVTKNNTPCLQWADGPNSTTVRTPHDSSDHNYCRNPNTDVNGLWCYTSFQTGNISLEYCGILKCETDARAIWTAYSAANKTTNIFAVNADPEFARQTANERRSVNVDRHRRVVHPTAEFWSITSDYDSKRFFYADYRSEYIGVYNLTSKTNEIYHDGMGHGVESMAYDTYSKNLYWADSDLRWIMAADSTFKYYAVVKKTAPDPAYGIAIHGPKRMLFFSTFRTGASRIWSSDMAGNNATVIVSSPQIDDVTGLTIDYENDRLYWTDFTQFGSTIHHSRLDGSNTTLLYSTRQSIYWGIGLYQNFVYVTDVRTRFNTAGGSQFFIWMLSRKPNSDGTRRILNYGLTSKARSITIYAQSNVTKRPSANPAGECDASPPCDQVCLPQLVGPRLCKCSLGYRKSGETTCTTDQPNDDFLIVSDSGQGKVFHIPLSATNTSTFTLLPLQDEYKAFSIAFNVPKRLFFWSDPGNSSIFRSTFDGRNVTKLTTKLHAERMAVDQQTGYVYFTDAQFQKIYVMTEDGKYRKTLYKPTPAAANTTNIQSIALDLKNKFVYWTDSFNTRGAGQLRRMRMDGSQFEIVYTNLLRPHGVAIDLQREKLYLGESIVPLIYELSLGNISNFGGRLPATTATRHLLSAAYRRRGNTYLSDIKVVNDRVFFYDVGNKSIEVFNVTSGASSVMPFGPREFFRVRSINVYSQSYYQQYEANQPNPCKGLCDQFCLAVSNFSYDCDCQDGYGRSGGICESKDPGKRDGPPRWRTCQSDLDIELQACRNTTEVTWPHPTWTDDTEGELNITFPTILSPAVLGMGQHSIRYSATDKLGNSGFCSFVIRITSNQCGARPYVSPRYGILQSNATCVDGPLGSTLTYYLTCPSNEPIRFGKTSNASLANYCMPGGIWRYTNFFGITCGQPVTTTTGITTTTASTLPPTTTTSTTTQSTAQPTTQSQSTAQSTTQSTTQTTEQSTTQTTAQSTTPATIQSTTTQTTTPSRTAQPTTRFTNKAPFVTPHSRSSGGLSTGAIVGIAVICILLVIALVAVVVVRARKKGSSSIFPLFWKPKEDRVILQENVFEDSNHYTVL